MKIKVLLLTLAFVMPMFLSCSPDEDAVPAPESKQSKTYALKSYIDTSNVDAWQKMMTNYQSSLDAVMAKECPAGMALDVFKLDVVEGRRSISADAQEQILLLAQPVRAWGAA